MEGQNAITKFPVEGQHVHKGVLLPKQVPGSIVDRIQDVSLDGDILVVSYPKCGSTWLQELVWLVTREGDVTEALSSTLSSRIPYIEMCVLTNRVDQLETLTATQRIVKSHLARHFFQNQLQNDKNLKILIPIRNPKDMLVSLFHFYQINIVFGKFSGTWNEFFEMFQEKQLFYGDFFDWYSSWWEDHQSDERVLFVRYEDMIQDVKGEIRKIATFLKKGDLSDDVIDRIADHCSFSSMKNNKMTNYTHIPSTVLDQTKSPFMRKGQVGDWKNYFSKEQSDCIDTLYKERFLEKGLELNFE